MEKHLAQPENSELSEAAGRAQFREGKEAVVACVDTTPTTPPSATTATPTPPSLSLSSSSAAATPTTPSAEQVGIEPAATRDAAARGDEDFPRHSHGQRKQQPAEFIKSKSQPLSFSVRTTTTGGSPGAADVTADTGDVIPVYVTDVRSRNKSDSFLMSGYHVSSPPSSSSSSPACPRAPPSPVTSSPPPPAPLPPPPSPPSYVAAAAAPLLPQRPLQKPEAEGSRRRGLRMTEDQRRAVKRHLKNALKKFFMFLVSHVGLTCLVVAYSIMGGFIFEALEAPNEAQKRTTVIEIRQRALLVLWNMTLELNVLQPDDWMQKADVHLKDFQRNLYEAVKGGDWEGMDYVDTQPQWSFAGSLLYSVTVITTIGYGNVTPKTAVGRVVTMLYAVVGIPMTLLCLTNIGSFMASCFRILWKQIVCRPCRNHIRRRSRFRAAQQKAVAAAYVANLVKQKRGPGQAACAASGEGGGVGGGGGGGGRGYDVGVSDSPAAFHDSTTLLLGKHGGANDSPARSSAGGGSGRGLAGLDGSGRGLAGLDGSGRGLAGLDGSSGRGLTAVSVSVSSELQQQHNASNDQLQGGATSPRPDSSTITVITTTPADFTPRLDRSSSTFLPPDQLQDPPDSEGGCSGSDGSRDEAQALPDLDPADPADPDLQAVTLALPASPSSFASRSASVNPPPPLIVAAAVTTTTTTTTSTAGEGEAAEAPPPRAKKSRPEVVRVPIMVCLVLVAAYIVLGAVLFSVWEHWSYFDSSYFCFVTLSTIGFGDIVPGYGPDQWGNQAKRVSCTLYLLFGLALLAMCFELIQFECRQKFITLASAMGFTIDGEEEEDKKKKKKKDKQATTVTVAAVAAL